MLLFIVWEKNNLNIYLDYFLLFLYVSFLRFYKVRFILVNVEYIFVGYINFLWGSVYKYYVLVCRKLRCYILINI